MTGTPEGVGAAVPGKLTHVDVSEQGWEKASHCWLLLRHVAN
jgi:hypothetical protein